MNYIAGLDIIVPVIQVQGHVTILSNFSQFRDIIALVLLVQETPYCETW